MSTQPTADEEPCTLCDDPIYTVTLKLPPEEISQGTHQIAHAANTVAQLQHIARHLADIAASLDGLLGEVLHQGLHSG